MLSTLHVWWLWTLTLWGSLLVGTPQAAVARCLVNLGWAVKTIHSLTAKCEGDKLQAGAEAQRRPWELGTLFPNPQCAGISSWCWLLHGHGVGCPHLITFLYTASQAGRRSRKKEKFCSDSQGEWTVCRESWTVLWKVSRTSTIYLVCRFHIISINIIIISIGRECCVEPGAVASQVEGPECNLTRTWYCHINQNCFGSNIGCGT